MLSTLGKCSLNGRINARVREQSEGSLWERSNKAQMLSIPRLLRERMQHCRGRRDALPRSPCPLPPPPSSKDLGPSCGECDLGRQPPPPRSRPCLEQGLGGCPWCWSETGL